MLAVTLESQESFCDINISGTMKTWMTELTTNLNRSVMVRLKRKWTIVQTYLMTRL